MHHLAARDFKAGIAALEAVLKRAPLPDEIVAYCHILGAHIVARATAILGRKLCDLKQTHEETSHEQHRDTTDASQ